MKIVSVVIPCKSFFYKHQLLSKRHYTGASPAIRVFPHFLANDIRKTVGIIKLNICAFPDPLIDMPSSFLFPVIILKMFLRLCGVGVWWRWRSISDIPQAVFSSLYLCRIQYVFFLKKIKNKMLSPGKISNKIALHGEKRLTHTGDANQFYVA